jgi:hypothetical protein
MRTGSGVLFRKICWIVVLQFGLLSLACSIKKSKATGRMQAKFRLRNGAALMTLFGPEVQSTRTGEHVLS